MSTEMQGRASTDRIDRRGSDRRKSGRGGRRSGDRGRPWWQKGLILAAVCAVTRCWRFFRRSSAR